MKSTKKLGQRLDKLRANRPLYFAFIIGIVSAIQHIVDKHTFEYADDKVENKFVTYSYQLNQAEEAVNDRLEYISRNKLREQVDLDGADVKRKIDGQFDSNLKVLFDNYQTLVRKLSVLGSHAENVLSETENLLPSARGNMNDETYENLHKSIEASGKRLGWLNKLKDKMQEQIGLRNASGELAEMEQTEERQIELAVNNMKLITSLFGDDFSLLKRNHKPDQEIAEFKAASIALLNAYDFIVRKHNERVTEDKRNKSIMMLVLFLLLLLVTFNKEANVAAK
jgi:hypothetical protein